MNNVQKLSLAGMFIFFLGGFAGALIARISEIFVYGTALSALSMMVFMVAAIYEL